MGDFPQIFADGKKVIEYQHYTFLTLKTLAKPKTILDGLIPSCILLTTRLLEVFHYAVRQKCYANVLFWQHSNHYFVQPLRR